MRLLLALLMLSLTACNESTESAQAIENTYSYLGYWRSSREIMTANGRGGNFVYCSKSAGVWSCSHQSTPSNCASVITSIGHAFTVHSVDVVETSAGLKALTIVDEQYASFDLMGTVVQVERFNDSETEVVVNFEPNVASSCAMLYDKN